MRLARGLDELELDEEERLGPVADRVMVDVGAEEVEVELVLRAASSEVWAEWVE